MTRTDPSLLALTADDLMSHPVEVVPEDMPLRAAARFLSEAHVTGAPVVDAAGRCVGVLSTTDFVRWAGKEAASSAGEVRRPRTCSFQVQARAPGGEELVLCALPPGACPMQVPRPGPHGKEVLVCIEPHCVCADGQVVELEDVPAEEVRRHMTAGPVTVPPSTRIGVLARRMVDAHIHRVVVVGPEGQPVGVVSSTDVLAAVAQVAAVVEATAAS